EKAGFGGRGASCVCAKLPRRHASHLPVAATIMSRCARCARCASPGLSRNQRMGVGASAAPSSWLLPRNPSGTAAPVWGVGAARLLCREARSDGILLPSKPYAHSMNSFAAKKQDSNPLGILLAWNLASRAGSILREPPPVPDYFAFPLPART